MKFMLLVYNDTDMLDAMPQKEFDASMKYCFDHADELQDQGRLLQSEQLEPPSTARSVRIRDGKVRTIDGPFAETKEVLGGFNIIEAESMEEAVRIASEFPWVKSGCIEVRPIRDITAVRSRVGAAPASARASRCPASSPRTVASSIQPPSPSPSPSIQPSASQPKPSP